MKWFQNKEKNLPIKEACIFYFSGTGNARQSARWIAASFEQSKIPVSLIDIADLRGKRIQISDEVNLVGICSPTHGFHFPAITRNFIRRLPAKHQCNVFIINTRAGLRAGRLFLPGLSGLAHYTSAFRLILKGYSIVGLRPVDLPSNWISLHPAVRNKGIDLMVKRQKKEVKRFSTKLVHGQKDFRALWDVIQDILITPIALGYIVIGRFAIAKSFYASHACTDCGKCKRHCPVEAIKKIQGRMFWTFRCESCMQCMNSCPAKAIQTAHGFLFLFFYLFSTFLSGALLYLLIPIFPVIEGSWIQTGLGQLLADSILMLALLFIVYRALHWLLRFRVVERLMVWTSFTAYRFWGRYYLPDRTGSNN